MRAVSKNHIERFWDSVQYGSCWKWQGPKTTSGYGNFSIGSKKHIQAHRWAYEFCVAPIPEGLQLDHLCRVRLCVNPDHLEPVTCRENLLRGEGWGGINARKTHCKRGHEFTSENTYTPKAGGRVCRTCNQMNVAAWRSARRAG